MFSINRNHTQIYVIYSLVFILTAFLSYLHPAIGDDMQYSFQWLPGHEKEFITSFSDIISSSNVHYMTYNCRYVTHLFVFTYCSLLNRIIFAITNGAMYALLILVIAKLCRIKIDSARSILSIAILVLLSFQTNFLAAFQINYIWTAVANVFFLYLLFYRSHSTKNWIRILGAVFAIICGSLHEVYSIPICFALLIYWLRNLKHLDVNKHILIICYGLGALTLCLNPVALQRAASTTGSTSLIFDIYNFIISSTSFFVLAGIVIYKTFLRKEKIKQIYSTNAFYWNVLLGALIFTFIIGIHWNRQLFCCELFAIILSMRLLRRHSLPATILGTLSVVYVALYFFAACTLFTLHKQWNDIQTQYAQSSDGKVYVDLTLPFDRYPIPRLQNTYMPLYYTNDPRPEYQWMDFVNIFITKHLNNKYPGKPAVEILPIN